MTRRRAMMKRAETEEHWDFIWRAQADGTIPAINLATAETTKDWWKLQNNQTITLAWDTTGFDGATNRVLLYSNASFTPTANIKEIDLTETVGQITLKYNGTSGSPTFLISRVWANRTGPRFMGRYIKIRINPMA